MTSVTITERELHKSP